MCCVWVWCCIIIIIVFTYTGMQTITILAGDYKTFGFLRSFTGFSTTVPSEKKTSIINKELIIITMYQQHLSKLLLFLFFLFACGYIAIITVLVFKVNQAFQGISLHIYEKKGIWQHSFSFARAPIYSFWCIFLIISCLTNVCKNAGCS